MAHKSAQPSDDTSHNKYSIPDGRCGDNSSDIPKSDKANISAADNIDEKSNTWLMSPLYLFSTAEMAELLGKSPITVRLEARKAHIGTRRDGRWYFNHQDKDAMIASFQGKKRARRADISSNMSITAAILQRQDLLAEAVRRIDASHNSMARMLRDVFDKMAEWRENLDDRVRKLEGK